MGALWENYLMIERIKRNAYAGEHVNAYFWRTYDRQEIDLVEERGEHLSAFEFKLGGRRARIPSVWTKTYPHAGSAVVGVADAHEFVDVPMSGPEG
jgi:hypothetical protein